jgi:TonB family protein
MKYLVVLFCLLPSLAWAQNEAPPPKVQPRPHYCGTGWYPKAALSDHIEGTTTLSFQITDTGDIIDVAVAQSSGNGDLDNAAMACAKSWKYRPAMLNGKPITVPWKARVAWQIPAVEILQDCPPGDSNRPHQATNRAVYLSFEIEPDGTVKNVTISRASGDDDLDNAAVTCLKARQYKPPLLNGVPAEISTSIWLTWRPESAQNSDSASLIASDSDGNLIPAKENSH